MFAEGDMFRFDGILRVEDVTFGEYEMESPLIILPFEIIR